jgi:hypothetical protein
MSFNLAGHQEEGHTQPPPPPGPQRPRFNPTQIPSTGGSGTAINLDSYNKRNTDINGVFNNNSQNYCEYEVSTQHPNLFLKFAKIKVVTVCLPTIDITGLDRCQDLIMVQFQILHFVVTFLTIMSPFAGLSSTTGLHGAAFSQQMGFGGPSVPRMSAIGANIQQMDAHMGQKLENLLNTTFSQTLQAKSMAAGISGGGYDPQAAHSSSSRNVDGRDSMNTGMANLSLNEFQPHPSQPSDRQTGLKLTDQMGSSNPSTGNLSPQQGSYYNPSQVPHMNKPDIMASLLPTPPFGNNPNRPQPASTIPFSILPSYSGGPYSHVHDGNLTTGDHSVHRANIDSFNEDNNTFRDSYNNNSFSDFTGKHSGGMFYSMICLS